MKPFNDPLPRLGYRKWKYMEDAWAWTPVPLREWDDPGETPPQHVLDLMHPRGWVIVATGPAPDYKIITTVSKVAIFPRGYRSPD